jgi:peptidyl-dipeptidase A
MACSGRPGETKAAAEALNTKPTGPTTAEAKSFVDKVNADLLRLWADQQRADWIHDNFITDDTEAAAARAQEAVMAYQSASTKEATRYDRLDLDPDTKRQLYLIKVSQTLPAPSDPQKRAELSSIQEKMTGLYGKGKYCDKSGKCRDLEELSKVLAKSRDDRECWTPGKDGTRRPR